MSMPSDRSSAAMRPRRGSSPVAPISTTSGAAAAPSEPDAAATRAPAVHETSIARAARATRLGGLGGLTTPSYPVRGSTLTPFLTAVSPKSDGVWGSMQQGEQADDAGAQRVEGLAGDEPAADERARAHVLGQDVAALGGRALRCRGGGDGRRQHAAEREPERGREVEETPKRQGVRAGEQHRVQEPSDDEADAPRLAEGPVPGGAAEELARHLEHEADPEADEQGVDLVRR